MSEIRNPPEDWFIPAIEAEGGVVTSLDAVLDVLRMRECFALQLKERLAPNVRNSTDRITQLAKRAKELENTLRFRLGILRPDREGSWFRDAPTRDYGPFKSAMLMAPVFAKYERGESDKIRQEIKRAWNRGVKGPISFSEERECLWSILLGFKFELEQINQFDRPFAMLRLDRLPDDLPVLLESRALRAFLTNVRSELFAVRDRLDLCYQQLSDASELFWKNQRSSSGETGASERRERTRRREGASQPPRKELGLNFRDIEALRYMGFDDRPEQSVLRSRYLDMAKKLHPDLGGSEDAFKKLNRVYQQLSST